MAGRSDCRAPTFAEEIAWVSVAITAGRVYGAEPGDVLILRGKATRISPRLLAARRASLYLAAVGANLSVHALRRCTGMRRSTIAYHLQHVEDDRELRKELDALLDEVAARVRAGLAEAGRGVAA